MNKNDALRGRVRRRERLLFLLLTACLQGTLPGILPGACFFWFSVRVCRRAARPAAAHQCAPQHNFFRCFSSLFAGASLRFLRVLLFALPDLIRISAPVADSGSACRPAQPAAARLHGQRLPSGLDWLVLTLARSARAGKAMSSSACAKRSVLSQRTRRPVRTKPVLSVSAAAAAAGHAHAHACRQLSFCIKDKPQANHISLCLRTVFARSCAYSCVSVCASACALSDELTANRTVSPAADVKLPSRTAKRSRQ